jgi:hypothetical protein
VHVEILKVFKEVTKDSDDGDDVCRFDKTRRRLKSDCFMVIVKMRVREMSETTRESAGEFKKKLLHRTGIEPVPLAWKASMITTSPSVL